MTFPTHLPCTAVTQPIGTFYVAVLKAGEILARVEVMQRGLDEERQRNVQRELSGPRVDEIATFSQEPDAVFPTSIIVSAYRSVVRPATDGRSLLVGRFRDRGDELNPVEEEPEPLGADEKLGQVIDGQHRLAGLRRAGASVLGSALYDFELPIVFMVDLDDHDRAYIFSTINSKQTRVSSSLIYDLFGLSRHRSAKKTCHDVASALNAKETSPFYRALKMLGKKSHPTESLTQGSFATYLLPHLSRDADADESLLKAGKEPLPDDRCIFRKYFLEDRDEFVVLALENYFEAIKDLYPRAWSNPDEYALRRTVGFAALMRVLEPVWRENVVPRGEATLDVFAAAVRPFRERVSEEQLRDIRSSGGAAVQLARQFLGQ